MRVRYHVMSTAVLGAGIGSAMHSWPAALGCFAGGVFIDADHYWEYVLHRRKLTFRYQDLVDFCEPFREERIYLILHAYEYLVALWLLIFACHLGGFWIGSATGATVHLLLDQFTNPIKPLFYFLTFRIQNRFETVKILSEKNFSMQ